MSGSIKKVPIAMEAARDLHCAERYFRNRGEADGRVHRRYDEKGQSRRVGNGHETSLFVVEREDYRCAPDPSTADKRSF